MQGKGIFVGSDGGDWTLQGAGDQIWTPRGGCYLQC
jgi:hypothetical protein